jgi:hypothetical protein
VGGERLDDLRAVEDDAVADRVPVLVDIDFFPEVVVAPQGGGQFADDAPLTRRVAPVPSLSRSTSSGS